MTDTALENANMQKKQIHSEIEITQDRLSVLQDRLRSVERFIEQWHNFATGGEITFNEKSSHEENKEGPAVAVRRRTVGNSRKEIVAETAIQIIAQRNEPVGRSDLFRELTSRGIVLNGKDPEMVLSTMLWRMKDSIVRLANGGYWLADKSSPDGDYQPQNSIETPENE